MGKLLLASVAVAALTCQAAAQDNKINWAGSYVGVEAGAGFSRPGFDGDDRASGSDFNDTGFVGGIYAGHDWQHERVVYGISGNFDFLDFGNQVTEFSDPGPFGGKTDSYGYDLDWVASLRGRAGYLVNDNLLIYGTGGVAVTQVHATSEFSGFGGFPPLIPPIPGGTDRVSATRVGGVFGAGIEYALNKKWSFKTEYVQYLFGSVHAGGGSSGASAVSFNPSFGTLNVGVAYHF